MKQKQEVPRNFALTVIAIMAVLMLIILFQIPAQAQVKKSTSLEYHQKLQKENSWENYRKSRLKKAKKHAKENRKNQKEIRREEAINARINRYYTESK